MASQGNGAFDRYAYVNNNPVRYTDPTGHYEDDGSASEYKGKNYYTYLINSMIDSKRIVQGGVTWKHWGEYRKTDPYYCGKGDRWHVSVDGSTGKPDARPEVRAAMSGTVVYSDYIENGGFGNVVVVETDIEGEKFYAVYAHLGSDEIDKNTGNLLNSGRNVEAGNKVSKGDLIGYMGKSGYQDDIHLHFEVRTENNVGPWGTPVGQNYWAFSTAWKDDFVDISSAFDLSSLTTENIPERATPFTYCAAPSPWVFGDAESKYR